MRKLIVGAVAVCLTVGTVGVYLATKSYRQEPTLPSLVEEEQEAPAVTPFPLGELARQTQPAENKENAIEAIEPIVVEGPAPESSTVTEIGGERVPGENVPIVVTSAPRPDEEPGQERKMPYVEDRGADTWLGARLWAALCRVLTGEEAPAVRPMETQEPPVGGEEQAAPAQPETLRPLFGPAMDYHHHQQCCPYTGRCPIPYHPVPPPAVPESR